MKTPAPKILPDTLPDTHSVGPATSAHAVAVNDGVTTSAGGGGFSKPLRRYARFLEWRELHITDSGFVLLLSVIIGVLTGVAAWLLKLMIRYVTSWGHGLVTLAGADWLIILLPVVGIIITGLLFREKVSNGVERMVGDFKAGNYRLKWNTIYGSMIGSALTLGCGGTAGSEGPIAYTGAGIGSKLGSFFRVNPRMMRILVGCGAAAGIAGIFKAPIGGALFTLEVLRLELTTVAVMGVFLSSLGAALTAYVLSGYTLDIEVLSPGVWDSSTLLWVLALGIFSGLYSLYYTWTGAIVKKSLGGDNQRWIRWVSSGLLIGLMIYLFPDLYGEGYGMISSVLNHHEDAVGTWWLLNQLKFAPLVIIAACAGMLLFKGAGSSAANNGGGVAGDFAPTLFAGCLVGLLFGETVNYLGWVELNVCHCALIGMGATMAGIIRAPLMAIFLTTEMVGGVNFLLPVSLAALIAYCIVMLFKRDTFYHSAPFATTVPKLQSQE